jgi:hypothetical protein
MKFAGRHRGKWEDNIMKCILNKQSAIMNEFNRLRTVDLLKIETPFRILQGMRNFFEV